MFIGMENVPEFTFPSIRYFLLINMIPAIISPIMAVLINTFSNSMNLVPIFFFFSAETLPVQKAPRTRRMQRNEKKKHQLLLKLKSTNLSIDVLWPFFSLPSASLIYFLLMSIIPVIIKPIMAILINIHINFLILVPINFISILLSLLLNV